MAETSTGREEPRLSPALRRAIAADTIGCFVDNAVLGATDVAVLKKILAEDITAVPGVVINRKRALGALARSERSKETGELLARVLSDRERPERERTVAAAYLGLLDTAIAEGPLLAALRGASGVLRGEVIKALGQVGAAAALGELRKIQLPADDVAQRPLALARIAVAFREGAETGDLSRELGLDWLTVDAKPLDAKAVREIQSAIGGSTFGVELDPEVGVAFNCGRTRHALFVNKTLRRGAYLEGVARRPMIAGLIVSKAGELRYFTLRWLLLTHPMKNGLHMVLVRPNGNPAFEGMAAEDAKSRSFTLRDVGLERSPALIEGAITNDTVHWRMRVWQGPIRGKLRPRSITGAERVGPRAREPAARA